jgi:hypothetical protein
MIDIASIDDEPLGYRVDGCYKDDFFNTILDFADKIKALNREDQINSFIKTETQSLEAHIGDAIKKEETDLHKTVTALLPSVAFPGFPLDMHPIYGDAALKIEKIDRLNNLFILFIITKIQGQQIESSFHSLFHKKSEDEIKIETEISYLVNLKVVSITKAKDIKSAWLAILKDKTLTLKDLNEFLNIINKRLSLFPEKKL